jgi:hypothetical protein
MISMGTTSTMIQAGIPVGINFFRKPKTPCARIHTGLPGGITPTDQEDIFFQKRENTAIVALQTERALISH